MKRLPALASFILFIALCASIAYWAMQLFKPPARPVAAPPPAAQANANIDAAAGLFGGRSSVAVASNYQLRGVVVSGTADESVAILAAEGKPAQAIRTDMEVAPGVKVKEVHRDYVVLSENGVSKRVELPQELKSQAGADPAGRPPVPSRNAPTANRGMPNQQPSAADARRSAMFNHPSPPPAQAAPPAVQSSPPPAESSSATVGSSGTAGVGNAGSVPAGAAPNPANGGTAAPAAQPAAAPAATPSPAAPGTPQAGTQAATAASPQPTAQPSSTAPQLVPQQR